MRMHGPTAIWYPSDESIAQCSHFFISWSIVATLALFHWPAWACMAAVLAWAIPKEAIFDIFVEQDSWASSADDFFWYCVGGGVATGFLAMCGVLM